IGNMSRPVLLVSLLVILIITSQFEWRQQLMSDVDATPRESLKQQQIQQREESVKEKVILSQEKNIQSLNELVQSLKEQLRQCRSSNETLNGAFSS
ncbi:peptidyl-prolyl cis-trans isomerase G, partial [Perilla frutescens var. frutescens]